MEFSRCEIETPELVLSYLKGPENGPPMVWLHGVSGRALRWREQLEAFSDRRQVYALDARGHGLSGRTPGHYCWLDHARDLDAFAQGVLTTPAVFVGHSLGALQVVSLAAHRPDAVAAAVLEDPPLYSGERPDFDFTQMGMLEGAARSGMTVDQLLAVWPPIPWMGDALRREYAEGLTQLDPENLTVSINLEATRGFDVDACLARIRCPTLVLRAGGDGGALRVKDLDRALSRLARGVGATFEKCGHQIHAEQSEQYRLTIADFLCPD